MIKLTARINLSDEGGSLESATINTQPNNIGSGISSVLNTTKNAKAPFIIGMSQVGDGSTYESKVDYYIGSVVSDSSGVFSPAYQLIVEGEGVETITIVFDAARKQHPQSVVVDGNTVQYSGDYLFVLDVNPALESHTIDINGWSAPNSPLVITGIYANLVLEFDYDRISNIEGNHKDRASTDNPSYGIFSNSGDLHIVDHTGEIKRYAEKRILKSGLKLTMVLKDTLSGKQQVVGVYNTADWDYDYQANEATCSLKEKLDQMQDINNEGIKLDVSTTHTADEIYKTLQSDTPAKFNVVAYEDLPSKTKGRLESITIQKYYLDEASLWTQWTKLCELCRGHLVQNFDGTVILEVE